MLKTTNETSKKFTNFTEKLIFLTRMIYKKVNNKFKNINELNVINELRIIFFMKKFKNNINKKQFKILILKILNNKIYTTEQKMIIKKFK